MRRVVLLLVVGLALNVIFAGTAWAQGVSFSDDFDFLDTTRWSKGEHRLGRSYLDPSNVDVSGGNLRIALPARTLEGGEILTNDLHSFGAYSASMKLPNAPSSITGFFLYKSPDYESEIDVEIYNDSTQRIMFTTYAGGTQTHTETMKLGFDSTAGFHEYRFVYALDSVSFYVDGRHMKTWNDGIPQTSMHLMVNSWFPIWLEGRKPKKTVYSQVDRIDFVEQSSNATVASEAQPTSDATVTNGGKGAGKGAGKQRRGRSR